jgi:serine/threonine protein kinase
LGPQAEDNRVLVSERDQRRFMREVTAAVALSVHPHVADVYDAGVLPDGRPYMVLELCPGGSLADRLKQHGPLSVREARDIGTKISDAPAAAHAAGVLHRDVKPANILINSYGLVALSDFGLATRPGAATQSEMSVTLESLTPAYAPPEAFELTEPTATPRRVRRSPACFLPCPDPPRPDREPWSITATPVRAAPYGRGRRRGPCCWPRPGVRTPKLPGRRGAGRGGCPVRRQAGVLEGHEHRGGRRDRAGRPLHRATCLGS